MLGVGGVGSAALYYLASRGLRVLGLDRFPPGHDRGSSHGQTRVIRKAYFEHPSYVPLLQRAYDNWNHLEDVSQQELLSMVGLLEVGPEDGELICGVRRAAEQYNLPLHSVSAKDVSDRFPGFCIPSDSVAVFEPDGGFLSVEKCIKTYVDLAQDLGASLCIGEAVKSWCSTANGIEVRCSGNTYCADRLVIAAGPWAGQLLQRLDARFHVLRKHLHWYKVCSWADYSHKSGSPVFFYQTPAGCYYGFPSLDGASIKVAEHTGGEPLTDPLRVSRAHDPAERTRVERFLRSALPKVELTPMSHQVCMYTMSADEHFVVDRHPLFPSVCFAAGLSGHGFKFASVLGEVLANLATETPQSSPIEFLRLDRPSLQVAP